MTSEIPLVSVVIPIFNTKIAFLEAALLSIKQQTFRKYECIIIDDSTDEEVSNFAIDFVSNDDRFLYFHRKKSFGLGDALNFGLSKCSGNYIARMDADDISEPDRLAKQVQYLNNNKEISILGTAVSLINENNEIFGIKTYPLSNRKIKWELNFRNALAHPTVMFRSNIHKNGFNYSKEFKFCEDLELWLRLKKNKYEFANLNEKLLLFRENEIYKRGKNNWNYNFKARLMHFHIFDIGSYISLSIGFFHLIIPDTIRAKIYKTFIRSN